MKAAIEKGDAKELAELMRQDPGFEVNKVQRNGRTLLHYACWGSTSFPVIPLLLAHPDIDVNVKSNDGGTPFNLACIMGSTRCVREMLKDSRVKVNEPDKYDGTPLWWAASNGHLDVIRWLVASGREMDLGELGERKTDAIGRAKEKGKSEVVALLERFKENPVEIRHALRVEYRLLDELAAEMFALVVFVSDGLLQIKDTATPSPAARYLNIARRLPLELQMMLCHRVMGSTKEIIQGKENEVAFKELARRL